MYQAVRDMKAGTRFVFDDEIYTKTTEHLVGGEGQNQCSVNAISSKGALLCLSQDKVCYVLNERPCRLSKVPTPKFQAA